jgi:tetratricopeptide (TPR) repeat protein
VLDTAREDDIGRAHRDLARARRHRGQCAGAHPVEGEAGDALRDSRQERDVASERQALIADLSRRGHDHVTDSLRRQAGIPSKQLEDDLDGHVVGPRSPEESFRAGPAESCPNAVDVDDLSKLAGHVEDNIPVAEDWNTQLEREEARYREGSERLPDDADSRQRHLTRLGNAAGGAGLALLMLGRRDDAAEWFDRAARRYRESYEQAPPGSWGRPIGALKARILAGDWSGAENEARWALDEGAADADSPIGRYAAALALLTLGRDEEARPFADSIRERDDFPHDVANALATLSAEDTLGYTYAVESVLESFEQRDEYLEEIPVADTVIVLQALAERRGVAADLASALLPG